MHSNTLKKKKTNKQKDRQVNIAVRLDSMHAGNHILSLLKCTNITAPPKPPHKTLNNRFIIIMESI